MKVPRSFYWIVPVAIAALCTAGHGLKAAEDAQWPLWDGKESVAEYAKRVNLPATKTIELGKLRTMELVLVPAGKFLMGTPEPEHVDDHHFHKEILLGQSLLAASAGALAVMLAAMGILAVKQRQRPKFSLAKWMAMTLLAGVGVLSYAHWRHSEELWYAAQDAYRVELGRFIAASDNEKPAHRVTLTTPFYMGRYVVTQQQYVAVIAGSGTNPSEFRDDNQCPVEGVTWDDAQKFCQLLSGRAKVTVRLPTEAEWEFACRAGTTTAYSFGADDFGLRRVAWYNENSDRGTHPVGLKAPNAFGLYDMHGNVMQWCQDCWDGDGYTADFPDATDPRGPEDGPFRVSRGGSWGNGWWNCRSAYRGGFGSDSRYNFQGFRVVVAVEAPAR